MDGYKINEKDIETVLRYLRIKDPKNAHREYAVQKLMVMNELAKELANQDLEFAELLDKAIARQADIGLKPGSSRPRAGD